MRARNKKVQLSALIVCLRGIFEDKYYELSQKPKKMLMPTSLLYYVYRARQKQELSKQYQGRVVIRWCE